MANVGTSAVKIIDNDSDVVSVTNNRLDVNATLVAGATIDIGDVDMFLDGGTAILGGAGDVAAGVLRFTLAGDDAHFGTVGTASDIDGTIHGQLRYIGDQAKTTADEMTSGDGHLSTISAIQQSLLSTLGTTTYTEGSSYGTIVGAIRNDSLATLVNTDNEVAPLQVNASGALYVEAALSSTDNTVLDNILTKNTEIDAVLDTIKVDTEAIETAVELLDNAISGSEMQVDVVASLPAGSNAIGKLAANSGVDIGDVDVTSTVHPAGNGTFTSYARFTAATTATALTDSTNGINTTETAAKEVIIQADYTNSSYIMVGSSGATATTNGVRLNAGDTLVLPVANIANIYIDGETSSQNVFVAIIK